jgi:hypothetical protein
MARDYTKIKAWQLADELALLVYKEIGYLGTNKKPRPQGAALESKFLNPKPRSRNKFGMTKRREPNPLVMLLNVIEKSGV